MVCGVCDRSIRSDHSPFWFDMKEEMAWNYLNSARCG